MVKFINRTNDIDTVTHLRLQINTHIEQCSQLNYLHFVHSKLCFLFLFVISTLNLLQWFHCDLNKRQWWVGFTSLLRFTFYSFYIFFTMASNHMKSESLKYNKKTSDSYFTNGRTISNQKPNKIKKTKF